MYLNIKEERNFKWLYFPLKVSLFLSYFFFIAFSYADEPLVNTKPSPNFGTAFFVTNDGYLLTSFHIIKDKKEIYILESDKNKWNKAQLIKSDQEGDLALLKIEGQSTPLNFADWDEVPIGLEAYVIGYPIPGIGGRGVKITAGLYNGEVASRFNNNFFQLSAEVQKGNSGGPVLSPDLLVIGMVQSKLNAMTMAKKTLDLPQNVNFALKSKVLVQFLESPSIKIKVLKPELAINNRAYDIVRASSKSVVMVKAFNSLDNSNTEAKLQ
jgi:S1-C subfamily serine protease